MRAEGANETEIEAMLEELDAHHGNDDAEGKLVLAVLREAAPLPAPGSRRRKRTASTEGVLPRKNGLTSSVV